MENLPPLRIRTITYFTPNSKGYCFASLKSGAQWLSNARRRFQSAGKGNMVTLIPSMDTAVTLETSIDVLAYLLPKDLMFETVCCK